MAASSSSVDIDEVIERYIDEHGWEQDKAHCQNASKAVRRLVKALVETGSINEPATRIVYNLCQNDNAFNPANKKERIDNLDIAADAKAEIKERIDNGTGIVGTGTYSVSVEGNEEAVFDLFSTAIGSDDRDEIDAAIEEFAALGIDGVQNGILSPILYFLHPTKYPVSNDRSRTGMQKIFDYEMSGRLTSYLKEVEKIHEVRAEHPFKDEFRHLDSFFNWIESEDIELTEEKPPAASHQLPEHTAVYWVNQHNQSEIEEEYLRAKTDGLWHHDLTKLSPGDVVFHNFDNELVGISQVAGTPIRCYYHPDIKQVPQKLSRTVRPIKMFFFTQFLYWYMYTQITLVLDSSGSMSKIEDDTKGGFNIFLQEQREEKGTATVTLYDFDDTIDLVYRDKPIAEAPKLTNENYRPGGRTALYDALTRAIDKTADSIENLAEPDRPDNVIIVVLTDGKENASETPQDAVRERVEYRREEVGWEFLFIGANQDAALTAEDMGMDRGNSLEMSHSGEGVEEAYRSTSENISQARRQGSTGGYTDEDRQRQREIDE